MKSQEISFKTNSFKTTCAYCNQPITYSVNYGTALTKSHQQYFSICSDCFENDERTQSLLLAEAIKKSCPPQLILKLDKLDFIELAILYESVSKPSILPKESTDFLNDYQTFINTYQIKELNNAND